MMVYKNYYPHYFTATILEWKRLLKPDKYKELIISSLDYMVKANRIAVYGFVIMINHFHLIWHIKEGQVKSDVQRDILKYTAQIILKDLRKNHPYTLERFRVDASDRRFQIWERNPLSIELYSEKVLLQKLNYLHENPVRAGLVNQPTDYTYSSASFYNGKNEWPFLQHYAGYT